MIVFINVYIYKIEYNHIPIFIILFLVSAVHSSFIYLINILRYVFLFFLQCIEIHFSYIYI